MKPAAQRASSVSSPNKGKPDPYQATREFEAKRTPNERRIDKKVDDGVWRDDWSGRARNADLDQFEKRKQPGNCKARPKDSRVNRGSGSRNTMDQEMRFVPWCERKS